MFDIWYEKIYVMKLTCGKNPIQNVKLKPVLFVAKPKTTAKIE